MMERIHSMENSREKVETYKDVKLPKNIRQVGKVDATKKIYMEDYVMTYIKQLALKRYGAYQVAVLLGHVGKNSGAECIFIHGAVEVQDIIFDDEKVFTNEAWTKIYENMKTYFNDAEIVGWFLTRPGLPLEVNNRVTKLHLDNFSGPNKVLLLYDSVEREEMFYIYYNGKLNQQVGYYIYYEKNDTMQSYMVDHKDRPSIEAEYEDYASKQIRNVLDRKKEEKDGEIKGTNSGVYAVVTVAAVFVLVLTANLLSNIPSKEEKEVMVQTTDAPKEGAQNGQDKEDSTVVNVIGGNISSIKEEPIVGDNQEATAEEKNENTVEENNTGEQTTQEDGGKESEESDQTQEDNQSSTKNEEYPKVIVEDTDPVTNNETAEAKDSTKENAKKVEAMKHIVQKGETLGTISIKYYHTKNKVSSIMKANNLTDGDKIKEGQVLILP